MPSADSDSAYAEVRESQRARQLLPSAVVPVKVEDQRQQRECSQLQGEAVTNAAATDLSSGVLRRIKSQANNLDSVTFETFKPYPKKKRPASWTSTSKQKMETLCSMEYAKHELSQIYDIVAPFKPRGTEKPVGGVGYNNLSRPGYPMKELLSPQHDTLPTTSLYASLNIETGPAVTVYDVPRKSAQLYSVPDMEKKRKRRQKRNEQSKKVTAEEISASSSLPLEGHYDIPQSKPKQA